MRILNAEQVTNHGNIRGRKHLISILEAGLNAADPYNNVKDLFRLEGDVLYIGHPDFEAKGDPKAGITTIDMKTINRVFVVGAGKGIQFVAKPLEDILGDYLTAGEIIAKKGDLPILDKINVTYGGHPTPDKECVEGCKKIRKLSEDITSDDLVITIILNGGSSLLTLPAEGITIEEAAELTRQLQIKRGVPTAELNVVRDHIDQLKAGRLSRAFYPAKMIHLIGTDANDLTCNNENDTDYNDLMTKNLWLHNLPNTTTFAEAWDVLERHNAIDDCPKSIVEHLKKADPKDETVRPEEFNGMDFRVFGLVSAKRYFLDAAKKKAAELGYKPLTLAQNDAIQSKYVAKYLTSIAKNSTKIGQPFEPPVALFCTGEMVVSVSDFTGVGGTNQEFALAAATMIEGYDNVVMGSVDSDGTDGPGGLKLSGAPNCLGGGVVDGSTMKKARELGLDVEKALLHHDVSAVLWKLDSGLHVTQNISINDLNVLLIQKP